MAQLFLKGISARVSFADVASGIFSSRHHPIGQSGARLVHAISNSSNDRIPDPLKPNAVVDLSSGFWRAPFVSGKKSSELSNLGMAKYGPA
jgi:hypothetical protein